jgi:hypothetical protein
MRGANIFAILLVVGILLFGCTSPTPPAKPNGTGTVPSSGGEGTAPSETGGTSGSSGTGTGGTGSSGTGSSGTGTSGGNGSSGSSGGSGSAVDDLAGKGYEALVAMGVPLQCDITTTSQGKTMNMHVYMKGSEAVRSETTVAGSETCAQMVTIMKGKTVYMGCVDGDVMQGCKWLQMDINDSQPQTAGATAPPDYNDVPPADINCSPWVYDASKFVVTGKVCNLNDLMKGYGDYQIPDNN